MKKALNIRLAPVYILTAVLFSLICAGTAVILILKGVEKSFLLWYIPVTALLFIAWAVFCIGFITKTQKRFDGTIDKILSAFSEEDAQAVRLLNSGSPEPEQISRWICEQSELTKRSKENASAVTADISVSCEIFWRITDDMCVVKYGDYWQRNYGFNTLNQSSDIRNHICENDREAFENAVKSVRNNASRTFDIVVGLQLSPQKVLKVRIRGCGMISSGKIIGVAGTVQDISIERELEEQLESLKIKEQFLIRSAKDILYEVDVPENRLVSLNPTLASDILGFGSMNDFEGDRRPYWTNIHPDNREGFVDRFFNYDHMMIMPDHTMTYEYRVKNTAGDYIWVEHQAQVLSYSGENVNKVIGRITNINEEKKNEIDSKYKSDCDSLTGALLKGSLRNQYDDAIKGEDEVQAVVLLNVNRFRIINDQYGYDFGNMVMRKFVAILWENQKGRCIVGRGDDDNFIIGMMKVDEKDYPQTQIDKLLPKFNQPLTVDGKLLNVTFSAGASVPSGEMSFDEAYAQAETALKVCKATNQAYNNSFLQYGADTEAQYQELFS